MSHAPHTQSSPSPAVLAEGFGYRHAGRRNSVLRNISFAIEPGEKVLLLGASGSGKSTLLAAIAGVLGDAEDGESTGRLTVAGKSAATARGRVGLVLQDPEAQVISARVGDDVAFGAENLAVPREEIWRRVRKALDVVGLDVDLSHSTTDLSGGQKQRLAIAGVLAMEPSVICLDEPTANIDPAGVPLLRDAAIAAAESTGAALIVVEHRVDAWTDHVDRVIVLGPEGLIADGTPQEIFRDYADQLLAAGVWLPGHPPVLPDASSTGEGASLASAEPIISCHDLAIGYGADKSWFRRGGSGTVASGLNVAIPTGASTCIVGANGTGKSTLALTLGGLLTPISGEVRASTELAQKHSTNPLKWRSRFLASRIGNVFQSPEHQFVCRTVAEELELGPNTAGVGEAERTRIVDDLLERLRLAHIAKANPFSLSGGEKRRLSVATVLSSTPDLVILDEPTFGQDRNTFIELLTLLRELTRQGKSIVSVTHDPLVVSAMGDDVIDLSNLVGKGTSDANPSPKEGEK